ncbi:ferritin-like domain-containing protein [Thiobacillus sp.]|uniref:ferritin-like domain-containing protein n=1 Tax=Thiobacillus sp. TaxID=924 RepID=UPI00286D6B8C|nr:ferritin-like domain-containing protein [Thiobacillus sp.]
MPLPWRLAECLRARQPADKVACVHGLQADWLAGHVAVDCDAGRTPIDCPGQPDQPALIPPQQVPRRRADTVAGRAALIHALAHIEFNAINLALDAAHRFAGMPPAYYADWLRVADEEALHFDLLNAHLATLGHTYGDFPAHNGLWEMALRTADDPLVRMALVPRVLEARGLDATPLIVGKLKAAQDLRMVEILGVIERDEIGHVAIGSHWFEHLCRARGVEPAATFRQLLIEYDAPPLKPPFNLEARRLAGFSQPELDWLSRL